MFTDKEEKNEKFLLFWKVINWDGEMMRVQDESPFPLMQLRDENLSEDNGLFT